MEGAVIEAEHTWAVYHAGYPQGHLVQSSEVVLDLRVGLLILDVNP